MGMDAVPCLITEGDVKKLKIYIDDNYFFDDMFPELSFGGADR